MPNTLKLAQAIAGILFITQIACKDNPVETFEARNDQGQLERYQRDKKDFSKEGLYQLLSQDGKLLMEAHYHKNKLNGEKKYFFPNGNVESIENYQDDVMHGDYKKFFENGTLEIQQHFENGAMQGLSIRYYPNGQVQERVTIKDNDENGPFQEYYENGKLKTEGTYSSTEEESAMEQGELKEYNEQGELMRIADCVDGKCVTRWKK